MNARTEVILLLGAGFTSHLGVPTMTPFFQDFLEFAKRRYPELQPTLDGLVSSLKDEADLESLLSALNSAVDVGRAALPPSFDKSQLESWIQDAKALRAHLLAYIIERCEQFDRGKAEATCGPFFKSLSEGAIVFTTNYDRVPEYLCEILDLSWTDGFERGKIVSPWRGTFDDPLAIAKLHGSVTWYVDSASSSSYLRLDRGYPLPGPEFKLSKEGRELDPLMIIPTLEKQTLGPPYNQLQNLFADSLSKARLLTVIGSSLRDDHIVGAIEFRRETLTVLVVGRNSRQTAARLQNVAAIPLEADSESFLRFALDDFLALREAVVGSDSREAVETPTREFAESQERRIRDVAGLTPQMQEAVAQLGIDDPAQGLQALEVVRGSDNPAVVSAVIQVLANSSHSDIRCAAAGCLGVAKSPAAIAQLSSAAIDDPEPGVRLEASLALSTIGTAEALEALKERASRRPDDSFVESVLTG